MRAHLSQNKRSFFPLNAVGYILPILGFLFLSDSSFLPLCSSAVWTTGSSWRSDEESARSMRYFSSLAMGNETCCRGREWLGCHEQTDHAHYSSGIIVLDSLKTLTQKK